MPEGTGFEFAPSGGVCCSGFGVSAIPTVRIGRTHKESEAISRKIAPRFRQKGSYPCTEGSGTLAIIYLEKKGIEPRRDAADLVQTGSSSAREGNPLR